LLEKLGFLDGTDAPERGVALEKSPEAALRLARYFGTSAGFWVNLQAHFDPETASDEIAETIAREVNPRAA
jgi:plasmid maintenance system antidote protein VapI